MLYAEMPPDERERLRAPLKHITDRQWDQRLKILLRSSERKSVPELAVLFDCCHATIRQYIRRYQAHGVEGLKRRTPWGPRPKIPLAKEEWEDLLPQCPCHFERLQTGARNWTQELLQSDLREYRHVSVSQQAISAAVKRHRLRWNRGKLTVTSPDPLYPVKRDRVETLKKAAPGTLTSHDAPEAPARVLDTPAKPARLVLMESTDRHWCPDVGHRYVRQGEQRHVTSPGQENPWYALFGSLEYPTGEGVYTMHERKRHQEVRAHLEQLLEWDPDALWIVILDNASAQTTPKLDEFFVRYQAQRKRVFQPTYSPHVNLIERLWRLMRGQMTRHQFYPSLKELAEAIVEWLNTLSFKQFCSLLGIDEQQLAFVKENYLSLFKYGYEMIARTIGDRILQDYNK